MHQVNIQQLFSTLCNITTVEYVILSPKFTVINFKSEHKIGYLSQLEPCIRTSFYLLKLLKGLSEFDFFVILIQLLPFAFIPI